MKLFHTDNRKSLFCWLVRDRFCLSPTLWFGVRIRKHVTYCSLHSNRKDLQVDPYHQDGASRPDSKAEKEQILDLHQQTFENRRRFRAHSVPARDFHYSAACYCLHLDIHRILQRRWQLQLDFHEELPRLRQLVLVHIRIVFHCYNNSHCRVWRHHS